MSELYEITYWNDDGFRKICKYSNIDLMLDDLRVILESESNRARVEKYSPLCVSE